MQGHISVARGHGRGQGGDHPYVSIAASLSWLMLLGATASGQRIRDIIGPSGIFALALAGPFSFAGHKS